MSIEDWSNGLKHWKYRDSTSVVAYGDEVDIVDLNDCSALTWDDGFPDVNAMSAIWNNQVIVILMFRNNLKMNKADCFYISKSSVHFSTLTCENYTVFKLKAEKINLSTLEIV